MEREEALKRQFVREARIGVTLIGITLSVFLFVAYSKMSGGFSQPTDMGSGSREITATTLNPLSQRNETANASVAAIQAATQSVVGQVSSRPGDTSATQSPPMPLPNLLSEEPTAEDSPGDTQAAEPDVVPTQLPHDLQESLPPATSPERMIADPLGASEPNNGDPEQIGTGDDYANLSRDSNSSNPPSVPKMTFPNRQVSGVEAAPILNRPLPTVAPTNRSSDGERAQERTAELASAIPLVGDTQRDVVIQMPPRESLWGVAQRHYGDGRLFRALAAYNDFNRGASARVPAGTEIRIPSPEKLKAAFPKLWPSELPPLRSSPQPVQSHPAAGRSYVTQADDTLFAIARDQLGQASRFVEIIEWNEADLPVGVTSSTKLPAGIQLRLSEK